MLEQLAYLAEIIGVVLIVVSLVYLAQQLRQNTEMARVAAQEQWVQRDFDIVAPLLENKELAEVWVKGDSEFDSLDDADRQRLLFFERRAIIWWHHAFQLRQQGLYRDAEWHAIKGIIRAVGQRQALCEAWSLFESSFEPPFREFIKEQLDVAARGSSAELGTAEA